jgi:hypothetical protein
MIDLIEARRICKAIRMDTQPGRLEIFSHSSPVLPHAHPGIKSLAAPPYKNILAFDHLTRKWVIIATYRHWLSIRGKFEAYGHLAVPNSQVYGGGYALNN